MKYIFTLIAILMISCGGGGSSSESSSSSASSSINASSGSSTNTSSNYDKITEDYSNKNWLAFSTAVFIDRLSPQYIGNTYSDSWIENLGTAGIYSGSSTATTILETSEDFSINNKGTLIAFFSNLALPLSSYDFTFKSSDATSYTDLFEAGKSEATLAVATLETGCCSIKGFGTLQAWHDSKDIDYVSGFFMEVTDIANYEYWIPTIYGDRTISSELPSNTANGELSFIGFINEESIVSGTEYSIEVASFGTGSLNFNFASNALSGSLTYSSFCPKDSFFNGNCLNTIVNQNYSLQVQNGVISGNSFTADVLTNEPAFENFKGYIQGNFYGPKGENFGATIYFIDTRTNDEGFVDEIFISNGFFLGKI
tara:strand:+ start:186 stop:1292 length:1107 start_codon:yes stop_codon:yes gene_type:complete